MRSSRHPLQSNNAYTTLQDMVRVLRVTTIAIATMLLHQDVPNHLVLVRLVCLPEVLLPCYNFSRFELTNTLATGTTPSGE